MMKMQDQPRDQLLRVVNDIIYMAHRIRVPSNQVKNIFVDQILRLDELKRYFTPEDEAQEEVKEEVE